MREGWLGVRSVTLAVGVVLALGACGGAADPRRTSTPAESEPAVAEQWWREPVEQPCEDDTDCAEGQQCQTMRLGTCENCPPGEATRICVDPGGAQASY